MIITLFQRAKHLVTEEDDKIAEVDHTKEAFKAGGYKPLMFN